MPLVVCVHNTAYDVNKITTSPQVRLILEYYMCLYIYIYIHTFIYVYITHLCIWNVYFCIKIIHSLIRKVMANKLETKLEDFIFCIVALYLPAWQDSFHGFFTHVLV